ncbi:unnamed protein product [Hymenolepis diminuta]|uniref:Hexosyltransferase n=1 Tax=Hymenolepis diminuta TaxID=6216 RepID=A0A564YAK0_HYMDI|nr:unnamed protein product [Hymenolepis diminuta]
MQTYSIRWLRVNILIVSVILLLIIYLGYIGGRITSNGVFLSWPQPVNFSQCKWPPTDIGDIENNRTFNITLCIQLSANATYNDKPKRYQLSDLFSIPPTNGTISFDEMPNLTRTIFNTAKYPKIYDTYPQDVPIHTIIEQVKAGLPVSYKPKYNHPIKILRTSGSVCSGVTRHNLVVVVKSGVHNFAAREEFRTFMKNQTLSCPFFRVGYVFSVGLPRAHGGRIFNRDGNIVNLPGAAGDALEKYDGKSNILMDEINKEIDKYDDLILGDYEDTYFNLSWKTVTNLRWISAFCSKNQGDFFMIIDDDHRMNLALVRNFAKEVKTSYLRTSIHGKIRGHDKAIRSPSSKNFVSYREIPWDDALPYPMGMSQLIGADIVDDMAIATAYTKYAYLNEDVYLGLLAHKLGITIRNVVSMFNHDEYKNYEKKYSPMVAWKRYF